MWSCHLKGCPKHPPGMLATPCWGGPAKPKQLSMAANGPYWSGACMHIFSFVKNCTQKRLHGQFNTKWPLSLIHVAKPLITPIRAIAIDQVKWLCACVMCWPHRVGACVTLLFFVNLKERSINLAALKSFRTPLLAFLKFETPVA